MIFFTVTAEEFAAHARAVRAITVAMRCFPGEAGLAYGPFSEGLRDLAERFEYEKLLSLLNSVASAAVEPPVLQTLNQA